MAFSVGLAAVLIAIGLLMVYARRFMAGIHVAGPVVRRWLPLASAAVITVLGVSIASRPSYRYASDAVWVAGRGPVL